MTAALPSNMPSRVALELCPNSNLPDFCWGWTTHQLAYELPVGPIPDGLQINHLCQNRRCCNPAHLEPVTARVNVLRAVRRDVCLRGHEYTPENTILKNGGSQRNCRICANEWQRNNRWKAANAFTGEEPASA